MMRHLNKLSFASSLCIFFTCSMLPAQELKLDAGKRRVTAGRLQFTLGANGLPAQISIQAAPADLPLEFRGKGAKAPGNGVLKMIGRGPQLATPMQVIATIKGKEEVLKPKAPATPTNKNGVVLCTAELNGGGVTAKLQTSYDRGGAVRIDLAYRGGAVEALALVMRMSGPVDTVVQGVAPFGAMDYGLSDEKGLLWGNAAPAVPAKRTAGSRGKAEVPRYLFWGNGDRGFSLLCEKAGGWTHVRAAPAVTLTREKGGVITWRALLVNHPAKRRRRKRARLVLLTHPATLPTADRRQRSWIAWPHEAARASAPAIKAAALPGKGKLLRADVATAYESQAAAALVTGPAGGAARSAKLTLADTYSLPLFRYLAGTHTGLPVRLLSNSPKISQPGMNPAADRMAVARALLHDIGFDYRGAVHRVGLARVVSALAEFGCFEADGMTEFLPYWRSKHTIRYGETFSKDDAFAETATDPMARVHVSVWLRPSGEGRQSMILIVNESDKPVRQQLYVLNSAKLFGNANALRLPDLVDRWDMDPIPKDSDWSKAKLRGAGIKPLDGSQKPRKGKDVPFLLDLEDHGGVAQSKKLKSAEVYQRVYVPARSFRLLFGRSKDE